MRKLIFPLLTLSAMMFACNIQTPIPPATTTPSRATPTLEISPLVVTGTPAGQTEMPGGQTNTTCNELSVNLNPALASNYTCETIPESPEGIETYPQYTKLTLQGYPLSGTFFTPSISILPIERYMALLPDFIPGQVTALQTLLGGGTPGDKDLPLLPTLNAGEMFHAQYKVIPFASGDGIRYMTLLAQFYAPINNKELFYTYQGLTQDGKFWISAMLPINSPLLPANGDNPPGGQSWDQFTNNYSTYIADLTNQLNSQMSGNFTPSLDLLDALVVSITLQP